MPSEPKAIDRVAQAREVDRDLVARLMAIERTSYLLVIGQARDPESRAVAPCPACGSRTFSRDDPTRWACGRCHRVGDIFDAWGWAFTGERLPREPQMRRALPKMAKLFPSHEERQAQAEGIEQFKRSPQFRRWLPRNSKRPAPRPTYHDWTDDYIGRA